MLSVKSLHLLINSVTLGDFNDYPQQLRGELEIKIDTSFTFIQVKYVPIVTRFHNEIDITH